VLGLWRVCVSYGLDTEPFTALYPQYLLRHAAFSGGFGPGVAPATASQCVAVFGLVEALCHCRLVDGPSPAAAPMVDMVS
jgi:hypothetical protein